MRAEVNATAYVLWLKNKTKPLRLVKGPSTHTVVLRIKREDEQRL